MKKLMIIASVAFMAIGAQAAQLKWAAKNIYIPVVSDVTKDKSGIVAASGDKFATGALAVNLFWVDSVGAEHAIGTFDTTGTGVIKAQVLSDTSATGDGKALYEAMLAEGGSYIPAYTYTATYSTKDGVYTYSGSAVTTSQIQNLPSLANSITVDFSTTGTWNYKANAVPEPTSGLLLLLGVAGLALRRRRA